MNEGSSDETWNQNELASVTNPTNKKRLIHSSRSNFNPNEYNNTFPMIKNQSKHLNNSNRNKENSSWSSNDSFSEDGNENSLYDDSLELND